MDVYVGLKVVDIRNMTQEELNQEGWDNYTPDDNIRCIVFDNGVVLYPSMDYEGNGPGAMFGYSNNGELYQFAI